MKINLPLIVLYFSGENGLTPAQLQKVIFLFQKAFSQKKLSNYKFRPHNYGPFNADIYRDIERLADQGLCDIHQKQGYKWNTYHILPAGIEKAESMIKNIGKNGKSYLVVLVSWVQSVSFQELIGSIYKKYPEYKVNSIFRE